jgi:hypothetical protein
MALIPDRKDFVEIEERCARLSSNGRVHGFPSGIAYILRNQDGKEFAYGPSCVLHEVSKADLHEIPDFTTRDVEEVRIIKDTSSSEESNYLVIKQTELQNQTSSAKRYLLLRMEKVANLPDANPGIKYAPLNDIYNTFRHKGELTCDQVNHILSIEKNPKTPLKLKSANLLDVYTAHVKLMRMITLSKNEKNKNFLNNIRCSLVKKLYLSPKQIESAGLKLHPLAFPQSE